MQKSIYGNTAIKNEYLIYPFIGPIKYNSNHSGTFSKYSLVDKHYVDSLVKPGKRLIYGGVEWNDLGYTGLNFELSNIAYSFGGEVLSFTAAASAISLATGDSTHPRIDAIVINEDGSILAKQGVPSATPQRPEISEDQILIQYARIEANATSFGASEAVYLDNGQWITSTYQISGSMTGSVNFTAPNPYLSTSCIEVDTDYRTGINFTKTIGTIDIDRYSSITMRVKLVSAIPNNRTLNINIGGTSSTLTGNISGSAINLMSYGLDREAVGIWQHIVVPTAKFGTRLNSIKQLNIRMSGGAIGEKSNWKIDYILFQKGAAYDEYLSEPDGTGTVTATSGGGVASGSIGPAEDGDYTDGVFADFTPATPVGTAIDRFNELFMALVPPSAPSLSDWSGARAVGVNGKLSFDTSNPISGSTYFGADTAPVPVAADGTWAASGKRLSIYAASNTNGITGTLNNSVSASPTLPTPAYSAYSFGDAEKGYLKLTVNGTIVSTASLSTLSAIDTTLSSSVSGFSLSAATSSKFSSGAAFETFKNRIGTYLVKSNDPMIRYGYNYVIAEHSHTSFTRTLARYEFVVDHNTDATSFSNNSISSYLLTGEKYLSGISFYTGGYIKYNLKIDNLYRNTYYSGSDAITFNDASGAGSAGTNPILSTSAQYSLPISGGDELKSITLSTIFGGGSSLTFSLVGIGKRRLNDSIGISANTKRTLQGNTTGGLTTISNVYLDNSPSTSTDLYEGFDDESRRLKEGTYNLISDVSSGTWESTDSLVNGDSYHNTGLQVYNSSLIYPTVNFGSPGSLTTNPNFANLDRNYTLATGNRVYIRYFRQVFPTAGDFSINIAGSGGTFVPVTDTSTANWIHLEIKAPGVSSQETGWLDAYGDFANYIWSDGNGARKSSIGAGRAFSTLWGLTIGTKNTQATSGYIVVRITVPSGFTGSLSSISFAFV